MRRLMTLICCALTFTACTNSEAPVAPTLAVPKALANQGGAPEPLDVEFELDVCGFPIDARIFGKEKFIAHPNGRLLIAAPSEAVTLTNVETGKTTTLGITGMIQVTFLENGDAVLDLSGRSLFERADGLFLTVGNWSATIDLSGNEAVPLNGTGRLIDVCALLS